MASSDAKQKIKTKIRAFLRYQYNKSDLLFVIENPLNIWLPFFGVGLEDKDKRYNLVEYRKYKYNAMIDQIWDLS